MTPPRGVGMWITWLGRSTNDVDNACLIEQAKRAGIGWLCVKMGDGGRSTRWLARGADLIARAVDAGIGLYTWNYSRPESWSFQADEIARVLEQGSMGHVIDAEIEWEWAPGVEHFSAFDQRPAAAGMMSRLRSAVGDAFIAHAPIWSPRHHPRFPWAEFGARVDAVMPQFYWTAAREAALKFCTHADADWLELLAAHPEHTRNVWPIGITYGAGDGWDLWTSAAGAVRLTDVDVDAFLQRYRDVPVSLFAWDAANGAVWKILNGYEDARRIASENELERMPDTLPAPPDAES